MRLNICSETCPTDATVASSERGPEAAKRERATGTFRVQCLLHYGGCLNLKHLILRATSVVFCRANAEPQRFRGFGWS